MSGGGSRSRGAVGRLTQAFGLVLLFGLLYATTKVVPDQHGVGLIAAVGFLLLAGTLLAELADLVSFPHLSGYLLAGILAGPHVGHLISHETVESMGSVNTLALALIALGGGAELKLAQVVGNAKSLIVATLMQFGLTLGFMTAVFYVATPIIPFTDGFAPAMVFGIALLWGVVATARSPSAALAILSQTHAQGPLATFTLAFIMMADVVVVVLLAAALAITKPLFEPGAQLSLAAFEALGHELLGSVSLGTTLGLLLAVYLRVSKRPLLLVLITLGFGFSEVVTYLRLEPLLTFIVAGFVVQNLSSQGARLIHEIEKIGALVYVLFFAAAGAHLNIPLLAELWPVALVLAGSRAVITFFAAKGAARLAGDPPALHKWGWSGLLSQAGFTLGIAAMISRTFPSFGAPFGALAIATVAINEVLGPIVFKLALDRAGETRTGPTHHESPAPASAEEPRPA